MVDPHAGALDRVNGTGKTFTIATRTGDTLTCEGRLYSVPWQGESALMLALIRTAAAERMRDTEITLRAAEAEIRELRSILDTATDGIVVVDRAGLILSLNRPAEALFGYEYHEIARRPFTELFAPGKRAPGARLSRRSRHERGRKRAQRRARGDRPRAPGRADPAVHDHGPHRRGHAEILRRAARHHAVEARRGGPASTPSAPPSAPHRRNPISWRRSPTRFARRSTRCSASPR